MGCRALNSIAPVMPLIDAIRGNNLCINLRAVGEQMRKLLAAILLVVTLVSVSWSQGTQQNTTQNSTSTSSSSTNTHHDRTYTNSSGKKVKSPEHYNTVPESANGSEGSGKTEFSIRTALARVAQHTGHLKQQTAPPDC